MILRINETLVSDQPATGLRAHNLGKIENMMHRVVTSIGYGYLNRLPLIHAFRWVDFEYDADGLAEVYCDARWRMATLLEPVC